MCQQVDEPGRPVALFNVNGTIYAIHGTCTHRGGLLGAGDAARQDPRAAGMAEGDGGARAHTERCSGTGPLLKCANASSAARAAPNKLRARPG